MQDQALRFLFDNHGVRGEIIKVENSIEKMCSHNNYPPAIKALLMDLCSAAILFAMPYKGKGDILLTIQAKSDSGLNFATINIKNDLSFYGSASFKHDRSYDHMGFKDLVGDGVLILTIFATDGQPYQGIVPLEHDDLALCLEDYFKNSEQLATSIILRHDVEHNFCGGMLLQIIPEIANNNESLQHLSTLASTISTAELRSYSFEQSLSLLFAQEEIRVFETTKVDFSCICSKERCLSVIKKLNANELQELLQDDETTMTCEHCGRNYVFSKSEIKTLFDRINQ